MTFQSLILPHLCGVCLLKNLLFSFNGHATRENFIFHNLLFCAFYWNVAFWCVLSLHYFWDPFSVDTEWDHTVAVVNEELLSLSLNSFLLQKDTSLASCVLELIASGSNNLNSYMWICLLRFIVGALPTLGSNILWLFILFPWSYSGQHYLYKFTCGYIERPRICWLKLFSFWLAASSQSRRFAFRARCRWSRVSLMLLAVPTWCLFCYGHRAT